MYWNSGLFSNKQASFSEEEVLFMGYSIYQGLWFFTIYAFLGWCTEVAFATLKTGSFVNRGFLSGPVCPIYGFGVSFVVLLLTPLKENLLLLFLGSFIVTSAMEYVTGYLLEKVFDDKWWDYSEEPFNVKGYICLRFSILWGLACVFIVDRIQLSIVSLVNWLPHRLGVVLLVVVLLLFIADAAVTIDGMLKLKRKLKLMREVATKLKVLSDNMGQDISSSVDNVMKAGVLTKTEYEEHKADMEQLRAQFKEARVNARAEIENKMGQPALELRNKLEMMLQKQSFTHRRLLNAFPNLSKGHNEEIIAKWKEHWLKK